MLRREFVDLALRDVQQLGDIGDGEGAAFSVQRIREARRFPAWLTVHNSFPSAPFKTLLSINRGFVKRPDKASNIGRRELYSGFLAKFAETP